MIRRNSDGTIHPKADIFAMHRRQLARARVPTDRQRETARRHVQIAMRMRHHTCNRGGRLNGWPICWFCFVEARLMEDTP